jgi:muconolactone D-isomerase
VDFLIDLTVQMPPSLPEEERLALTRAERVRGQELVQTGAIRDIWRVPGAMRNVAIWQARDATELHELLTSLPLHRYSQVHVTPLAVHPLRGGPEGGAPNPDQPS